jgi:hypothetical protein
MFLNFHLQIYENRPIIGKADPMAGLRFARNAEVSRKDAKQPAAGAKTQRNTILLAHSSRLCAFFAPLRETRLSHF